MGTRATGQEAPAMEVNDTHAWHRLGRQEEQTPTEGFFPAKLHFTDVRGWWTFLLQGIGKVMLAQELGR